MTDNEKIERIIDFLRIFQKRGYRFLTGYNLGNRTQSSNETPDESNTIFDNPEDALNQEYPNTTKLFKDIFLNKSDGHHMSNLIYPVKVDVSNLDELFTLNEKGNKFITTSIINDFIIDGMMIDRRHDDHLGEMMDSFENLLDLTYFYPELDSTLNEFKKNIDDYIDCHEKIFNAWMEKNWTVKDKFKEKMMRFIKDIETILLFPSLKVKSRTVSTVKSGLDIHFDYGRNCNLNTYNLRHANYGSYQTSPYKIIYVAWDFENTDYKKIVQLNNIICGYLNTLEGNKDNLFYAFFNKSPIKKWSQSAEKWVDDYTEFNYINKKHEDKNSMIMEFRINDFDSIGCKENDLTDMIPEM